MNIRSKARREDNIVPLAAETADDTAPNLSIITNDTPAPAPAAAAESTKAVPYRWILHPAIDLFFCCGGLFWLLLIAAFVLHIKLDIQTALVLNILGNILFTDTHQPATLFRVYGSERTRKSVGVMVTLWGALVLSLCGTALFSPLLLGVLLLITFSWAHQHLMAQVYGVSLIYCYKREYIMNNQEKQSLFLLTQAAICFFIVRMFSGNWHATVMAYHFPDLGRLPSWVMPASQVFLATSALYFAFMVARKWVRERKHFPLPALFTLLTGTIPSMIIADPIIGIFLQNFFHSSQYNVVTTAYFLKDKGLPEGVPFSKIATQLTSKRTLRYFGFLLLLGFTLQAGIPTALILIGFTSAGMVSYCALNLHHYFTDAAIWRMKDPVVRKLLVS